MADLTDEQLAEWEALEAAATRGPWVLRRPTGELDVLGPVGLMARVPSGDVADGEFIAAARTAVPLLLRALRDARAENAELRLHKSALIIANDSLAAARESLRAEMESLADELDHERTAYLPDNGSAAAEYERGCNDGYNWAAQRVRAALAAPTGQEESRG